MKLIWFSTLWGGFSLKTFVCLVKLRWNFYLSVCLSVCQVSMVTVPPVAAGCPAVKMVELCSSTMTCMPGTCETQTVIDVFCLIVFPWLYIIFIWSHVPSHFVFHLRLIILFYHIISWIISNLAVWYFISHFSSSNFHNFSLCHVLQLLFCILKILWSGFWGPWGGFRSLYFRVTKSV